MYVCLFIFGKNPTIYCLIGGGSVCLLNMPPFPRPIYVYPGLQYIYYTVHHKLFISRAQASQRHGAHTIILVTKLRECTISYMNIRMWTRIGKVLVEGREERKYKIMHVKIKLCDS